MKNYTIHLGGTDDEDEAHRLRKSMEDAMSECVCTVTVMRRESNASFHLKVEIPRGDSDDDAELVIDLLLRDLLRLQTRLSRYER